MNKWLRRIRGGIGMGLIWAVGGAAVGGLMEFIANLVPPDFPIVHSVDMWIQLLAFPGFLGGIAFSVVLSIAASRRRFDELSLPGFAALGAIGGLLLGALAMAIGAKPLILAPLTLFGAIAATGTLALARMGEKRELPGAGESAAGARLGDGEAR